jgi:hypothetical protein
MNPVWDKWIEPMYNPKKQEKNYKYPIENSNVYPKNNFKKDATLKLYDGCGTVMETWNFEGVYPEDINFDELSMEEEGIVNITLSLKYDRAYIEYNK